mmetsp:Transcript_105114/g.304084  ORF Transcript_105114/g.304084 Transcript_105114/m.304084 type:complete len:324 (+) Transcript_105114:63-1034(+)
MFGIAPMARAQIALVLTSILSVAWCSREEGLDTSTMLQVSAPPDAVAHAGADGHDRRTPRVMGSARDLTLQIGETAGICHTVFLTSVFTAWGNERRETPSLRFFERYYRAMTSLASGGPGAVVLYDDLPMDIVRNFSDDAVSFQKVDISGFDPKMSLDDLRYLVFEEQIQKHPEWSTIFITDMRDALVLRDPCSLVDGHADKLFAGSRPARAPPSYDGKLVQVDGNYLAWNVSQLDTSHLELNPMVLGGKRPVILKALGKVRDLLSDQQLSIVSRNRADGVNASAITHAAYSALGKDKVMTGVPLHSKSIAYDHRTDDYFWCK